MDRFGVDTLQFQTTASDQRLNSRLTHRFDWKPSGAIATVLVQEDHLSVGDHEPAFFEYLATGHVGGDLHDHFLAGVSHVAKFGGYSRRQVLEEGSLIRLAALGYMT